MKINKFNYLKVLQCNYGYGQWEDLDSWDTSKVPDWHTEYGKLIFDLRLNGYPWRLIDRREPNPDYAIVESGYDGRNGLAHSAEQYQGFWIIECGAYDHYGFLVISPSGEHMEKFNTKEEARNDIELGRLGLHD